MKDSINAMFEMELNGHEKLFAYMKRNHVSVSELARYKGCSTAWLSSLFAHKERPTEGYYLEDLCAAVAQILKQREVNQNG